MMMMIVSRRNRGIISKWWLWWFWLLPPLWRSFPPPGSDKCQWSGSRTQDQSRYDMSLCFGLTWEYHQHRHQKHRQSSSVFFVTYVFCWWRRQARDLHWSNWTWCRSHCRVRLPSIFGFVGILSSCLIRGRGPYITQSLLWVSVDVYGYMDGALPGLWEAVKMNPPVVLCFLSRGVMDLVIPDDFDDDDDGDDDGNSEDHDGFTDDGCWCVKQCWWWQGNLMRFDTAGVERNPPLPMINFDTLFAAAILVFIIIMIMITMIRIWWWQCLIQS